MGKLGEDVTEVLDYVPGHFQVIRHVRPKYACRACDAITQAPAPAMPTPRGRATPSMLAHLLVSKYVDHLPLYRQCEIYAREGLELDRSTLCDWVGQAAWLLDPIVAAIRAPRVRGREDPRRRHDGPGAGARPWPDQDRTALGLRARRSAVLRRGPPAAAYFYSPDRTGAHPAAHMASFTGLLQADGYSGFEKLYGPTRTKPGPITEVACWAHTRRGFFDEWEQHKSANRQAGAGSDSGDLCCRSARRLCPIAERVELRREAAPLVDAFFGWAEATVAKLSAKSSLAGRSSTRSIAATPCRGSSPTDGSRWTTTSPRTRCVALPSGERIISSPGPTPAVTEPPSIYTIVQTAKLNGMNPEAYLRDTLTKIADGHPINRSTH